MKCRDLNQIELNLSFSPNKKYNKIKDIIGLDTETEKGKCFLLGYQSKDNKEILESNEPIEILNFLNQKKFRNTFNFFYNLTYDFQAIVKTLPYENIVELSKRNHTKFKDFYIKYIENKMFSLSKNNKYYNKFYDLAQFYNHMKLDNAGKKFLNIQKLDLEENEIDITRLSFKKYFFDVSYRQILRKYLFQDCNITYQLGVKLYNMMLPYMKPKGFYSQAYFSQQYFLENITKSFTLPKKEIMQYALNSYQGGRFETVQKGTFDKSFIYDIKSAYPFHNSKIPDISKGIWKKEKEYDSNALISLFNIDVNINDLLISPMKFQLKDNLLIYPLGKFKNMFVNKSEFEIINKYANNIKINDVWNYYDNEPEFPYIFLEKFFQLKEDLKHSGKDIESWIPKIFMNGFYGKTIQVIKQNYYTKELIENNDSNLLDMFLYNGKYIYQYQKFKAGLLFNPIVANEITANTKIQLFKSIEKDMNKVIGFQTDSIISDKRLNLNIGEKLGEWEIEKENKKLVIIGSGIYQVIDEDKPKMRIRGFTKNLKLYDILNSNPKNLDYELLLKRNFKLKKTMKMKFDKNKNPLSDLDRYDKFNLIENEAKIINVNFDRKRIWERKFKNFKDVLENKIKSKPILV